MQKRARGGGAAPSRHYHRGSPCLIQLCSLAQPGSVLDVCSLLPVPLNRSQRRTQPCCSAEKYSSGQLIWKLSLSDSVSSSLKWTSKQSSNTSYRKVGERNHTWIMDRTVMPRIYQELQVNKKKVNNPKGMKWVGDINQ